MNAAAEVDGLSVLDRIAARPAGVQLAAGLLVFGACSLAAMLGENATFDEGIHLSAGYSYLVRGDYRLNPEHPPLGKILNGIPLLALKPAWPADPEIWRKAWQGDVGYKFLFLEGNDADRVLFWGRLPTLFWGLLLVGSVFALARDLYGPRGGLIALVLASFCPTLLAHSHYVTTDTIVAVLLLLAVASFRSLYEVGGYRWSVYSGILLGGALASKFSAILLVPIVLWMGVVSLYKSRAWSRDPGTWLRRLTYGSLTAVLAFATLWGAYGFRQQPDPDRAWQFEWNDGLPWTGVSGRFMEKARDAGWLPHAYIRGYLMVQKHSQEGHQAYALRRFSDVGWSWYFPFAVMVKTPVGALLLYAWGLWTLRHRARDGRGGAEYFILIPLIIYGVLAVRNNINIGIRHVLPIFPLLMVLAGGIELPDRASALFRRARWALPALLLLAAVETLSGAPYFQAYFNAPSRLLGERHELLIDSNLDWGQDLKRLKRYLDDQGIGEIKLSYFGLGSPRYYQVPHQTLPGTNAYTRFETEFKPADAFKPGDVVAISASNFVGLRLDDPGMYLRRFGKLKPIAVIGNSIYVYRVP
ncbi:MAG TPA: glycosyltransferase family 39 protein [Planctomycetota bacterium]